MRLYIVMRRVKHMPLVYQQAERHRRIIASDIALRELEISGFTKCVARKTCLDDIPKDQRIRTLRESLTKQFDDWVQSKESEDEREALADLRNVAGLLFLALS